MDREYLNEIAKLLEAKLPDQYGFIVLAFPFGEGPDRQVFYLSNGQREDALRVLKEWLIKAGAEEDWMKHIT